MENCDVHVLANIDIDIRRFDRGDHREREPARCDSGEIAEQRRSANTLTLKDEP